MKFPQLNFDKHLRKELPFDGGIRLDGTGEDGQMLDMLNLQYNGRGLCVRPAIKYRGGVQMPSVPDRFFWANGITAAVSVKDGVKMAFFNGDGDVIDSGSVEVAANDAVMLLDKDKTMLYTGYSSGVNATILYRIGQEDSYFDTPQELTDIAYIPSVSVGGKGYLFTNVEDMSAFKYNSKEYESKNALVDIYKSRHTSEYERNVYVLPYPIGMDAEVSSEYTNMNYETYEHGFKTDETGAIIKESIIEDMDKLSLRRLNADRRTVVFTGVNTMYSKQDTPLGYDGCNHLTITVNNNSNGGGGVCRTSKCASFCAHDGGTTWVVYGSKLYPARLWLTGYGDNTYFPESGECDVGNVHEPIVAVVQLDEELAIMKENSLWLADIKNGDRYTEDQLAAGETDRSCGATVSISPKLVCERGCDCPNTVTNCDGRLVWLNSDGVVRMMTAVINPHERDVRELSFAIKAALKKHSSEELKNASATYCRGKYYLLVGNEMFVLDCHANAMDNYTSYYDDMVAQKKLCWYRWNLSVDGVQWLQVRKGNSPLLFGTMNGQFICCSLDGTGGSDCVDGTNSVSIRWKIDSLLNDFGLPDICKTSAKLTASITAENAVNAAVCTEDGCGGCVQIPPFENPQRVTVVCGDRCELIGAAFEGSGSVEITDASLSCRPTTQIVR